MNKYLIWRFAFLFFIGWSSPGNVAAQPNHLVISQVYAGAGCNTTGCSLYQNDFVEIFNPTTTPVNLNGWSVQTSGSSGAQWQVTPLTNFSLQPGQYYLVALAFNANGVNALPTPDATGSSNLIESGGRIALVNSTVALGGSCPSTAQSADFVGYGGANCSETSFAAVPGVNTSLTRKNGGCRDTDNNGADFELLTAAPRNKNTTVNLCPVINMSINDVSLTEGNSGTTLFSFTVSLSAPAPDGGVIFSIATADNTATVANNDYVAKSLSAQTIPAAATSYTFTVAVTGDAQIEATERFFVNLTNVIGATVVDGQVQGTILTDDFAPTTISMIQGNGNTSSMVGMVVQTQGIVTAVKSNGFFIQTPDGRIDSDPATSEGIFVFTSSTPPLAASVGNEVVVVGTVVEFIPSADPNSPSVTELISPSVLLLSTGNPLPVPIVLNASDLQVNSPNNLERIEGMRVQINSITCIAPTSGVITEASATAISNGIFYGVITGSSRPFRESGVRLTDPLPSGAPGTVPRWDINPEILGINTRGQTGSTALDVSTGAVLTDIVGVLDYSSRYYTVLPDPSSQPGISNNNRVFTPVRASTTREGSIATINLQRFYDNVDDPGFGDPILTTTAYNNRLAKASLAIRNVLMYPDVIGVAEVEKLSVLQAIASRVNADAVAAAQPDPQYIAYLLPGNDVGSLNIGFLVKSSRINAQSVIQIGLTDTYINPNTGTVEILFDRPPLVLSASITIAGCAAPASFTIVMNHLRSLVGIDDNTEGLRVRAKRKAQAEYLANYMQGRQTADPSAKLVLMGDFNAYTLSDGYVDVMGTLKGIPAVASQVVAASADLVNPNFVNLTDSLIATEQYTATSSGSAHAQDHVLVSQSLVPKLASYAIARLGADFPLSYFGDISRPEGLTDQDVPVVYLDFGCTAPSASTDHFRSKASGNWNSIATWESSANGIDWQPATLTPDFNANTITIMSGHVVQVTANVTVDQVVVRTGASVTVNTGVQFTIK